jgi:hypothetical protein
MDNVMTKERAREESMMESRQEAGVLISRSRADVRVDHKR